MNQREGPQSTAPTRPAQVIESTPEGVMARELQGDEEAEDLHLPEGVDAAEIARGRLADSKELDDILLNMLTMVM